MATEGDLDDVFGPVVVEPEARPDLQPHDAGRITEIQERLRRETSDYHKARAKRQFNR